MNEKLEWVLMVILSAIIVVSGIGIPFYFMYKICQGVYHILLLLIDKI